MLSDISCSERYGEMMISYVFIMYVICIYLHIFEDLLSQETISFITVKLLQEYMKPMGSIL